jgi:repressor LexA
MTNPNLSPRQREILRFLADRAEEEGRFPSVREIGEYFALNSPATVSQHLDALEAKGYLRRRGGHLTLHPNVREERGIPIVGRVAAGVPITAEEHLEGRLAVNDLFGPRHDLFSVRVKGDSMEDAGIHDGDLVVVRKQERVRNGEICVAYLGEEQEATVKIFRRRDWGVELEPRNERYRPIRVAGDDHFRIGGKVVGVVRRLG